MNEIAPAIFAIIGTLLGGAMTFLAQSRITAKQFTEARFDRRRDDFVAAASNFASATTKLLQAEYNRAKTRLESQSEVVREPVRQTTYDRRSEARLAQYQFQIISSPSDEQSLVNLAEKAIADCQLVSDSEHSVADLTKRHRAAKESLTQFVVASNLRADALYTRGRRKPTLS